MLHILLVLHKKSPSVEGLIFDYIHIRIQEWLLTIQS